MQQSLYRYTVHRIRISNLDDQGQNAHLLENPDQESTDKSIDQWSERQTEGCGWSEWWTRGAACCFDYLIHLLPSSVVQRMGFKNMRTILPLCIERYCGTVTKNVNLANDQLAF